MEIAPKCKWNRINIIKRLTKNEIFYINFSTLKLIINIKSAIIIIDQRYQRLFPRRFLFVAVEMGVDPISGRPVQPRHLQELIP